MDQDDGTTIYLLRHGESHANVRSVLSNGHAYDAGLTERGRRQSVEAAGWLQGKPLAALYTSPLRRAAETAAILSTALGCEATVCADVREIDVGTFDGRGDRSMWRDHDAILARWYGGEVDVPFPGGESLRQAEARIVGALETMQEQHPHGSVGVVTHSMIARFAVARLAPLAATALSAPAYRLGHGEIGALRCERGRWACLAWRVNPRRALQRPAAAPAVLDSGR